MEVRSLAWNGKPETKNTYVVQMTGPHGTLVEGTMQTRSVAIELPAGVERIDAPTAAERKDLNRAFNRTLAGNVAKANQERVLFDESIQPGWNGLGRIAGKGEIPSSAPLTLRARDAYGRALPPVRTNAGSKAVSQTNAFGEVTSFSEQRGGYEGWAVKENLFATPAFERDGKTFSKFLGLAAFPRNAKVVLTNTRLRSEGTPGHAVTVDLSTAGAGAAELPALEGDPIEITVTTPGAAKAQTFHYRVPAPTKQALDAARLKTNAGIPYLAVANFEDPATSGGASSSKPSAIRRALGWFQGGGEASRK